MDARSSFSIMCNLVTLSYNDLRTLPDLVKIVITSPLLLASLTTTHICKQEYIQSSDPQVLHAKNAIIMRQMSSECQMPNDLVRSKDI